MHDLGVRTMVLRALPLALLLAAGPLGAVAGTIAPVSPAPTALADGLAVTYYFEKFENIDQLIEGMRRLKPHEGEPLPTLNYRVGEGKVLTSDSSNFVGAHITGLIHFEATGGYELEVTSNDGVRVSLSGEMIYDDPEVHADWTSDPIPVNVETPGWYALEVLYFEKKNTSTLIMRWKPPGAADFEVVPEAALKHPGS